MRRFSAFTGEGLKRLLVEDIGDLNRGWKKPLHLAWRFEVFHDVV
jgi:hypothetical protein